jgi:hypothetical protein
VLVPRSYEGLVGLRWGEMWFFFWFFLRESLVGGLVLFSPPPSLEAYCAREAIWSREREATDANWQLGFRGSDTWCCLLRLVCSSSESGEGPAGLVWRGMVLLPYWI